MACFLAISELSDDITRPRRPSYESCQMRWNVTLLGLLDMSVALDCVDHDFLLQRLEKRWGPQGRGPKMDDIIPYRPDAASRIQRHVISGTMGLLQHTARIRLRFTVVHLVHGWPEHCCCISWPHTALLRWWLPAVPQCSGRRHPISNWLTYSLHCRRCGMAE